MELIAVLVAIATLMALLLQIHLQWKAVVADHERRKKQATIEYINSVRSSYRPISEKLAQKFGGKNVINVDVIDDETREDIKTFLSIIEHLSVGVNSGVYDLNILQRMSGSYLTNMFLKLQPYINDRRHQTGNRTLYCDFESMIEDIKDIVISHSKK